MRRRRLLNEDGHLDLVPLIDCVFLLLLFFMLCGNLRMSERTEQITVPPSCTASSLTAGDRLLLNLRGLDHPQVSVGSSTQWTDLSTPDGLTALRQMLDRVWDRSPKMTPRDGVTPASVVLEIRADGDVPMRSIQAVQMLATGPKPFIQLEFTARRPG